MMQLAVSPVFFFFSFFSFGRSTPCSVVWWLLCLQWSVHEWRVSELISHTRFMSVHCSIHCHSHHPARDSRAETSQ